MGAKPECKKKLQTIMNQNNLTQLSPVEFRDLNGHLIVLLTIHYDTTVTLISKPNGKHPTSYNSPSALRAEFGEPNGETYPRLFWNGISLSSLGVSC
ncbi:hypothetical protein [Acinetobacter sp.]|uniref:hypothetical protein n=1 Tax=Acinetobacter sp. TaxID=472 RepID=UPI0031DA26AF